MNKAYVGVGVVLIIIALIVGGVQLLHLYNIYGAGENRWYFYGAVAVIGIIGIILAAWGLMKKEEMKPAPKQAATS